MRRWRSRDLLVGMQDVRPQESVAAIVEHQGRLRALLERHEPSILASRPPAGGWSAIEVVHHLVLTAQFHLGPFVPGGLGRSRVPGPQTAHGGAIAPRDVRPVLDEWGRVYEAAWRGLDLDDPDAAVEVPGRGVRVLSFQLSRFLRHQQAHGRQAARALSEATGTTVRVPRAPRKPGP